MLKRPIILGQSDTKSWMILTSFSVLTEHYVTWVKSSSTADVRPLLAIVGHVEGDPTLWQETINTLLSILQVF